MLSATGSDRFPTRSSLFHLQYARRVCCLRWLIYFNRIQNQREPAARGLAGLYRQPIAQTGSLGTGTTRGQGPWDAKGGREFNWVGYGSMMINAYSHMIFWGWTWMEIHDETSFDVNRATLPWSHVSAPGIFPAQLQQSHHPSIGSCWSARVKGQFAGKSCTVYKSWESNDFFWIILY